MNKELEGAVKRISKKVKKMDKGHNFFIDYEQEHKDLKLILNYIENSIPKELVEKKIIIDIDKLNHSTNGILAEMYKSRITLEKELLEGK